MKSLSRTASLAMLVALCAPAMAGQPVKFPERLARPGFQAVIADAGAVLIAGQPSEAALREMVGRGEIATVINVRTRGEMESRSQVPFDEAGVLTELGVAYFHIPLGGVENPYTPQVLDAFARAVAGSRGKVLLHCTVGARASSLWAAYLVRFGGYTHDEAVRQASVVNLPPEFDTDTPVNRLLGWSPPQP